MTGRCPPFTVGVVHARVAGLRRFRPDPLKVDRALAVLLTVGAQLEIWLSSEVPHHRLVGALVAPVVTGSLAARRRYPALVGTAVPVLAALEHGFGRDPQITSVPVAYFCALYALAAWT